MKNREKQTELSTAKARGLSLNKPKIKSAHIFSFVEMNDAEMAESLDADLPDLESILNWLMACLECAPDIECFEQKAVFALDELAHQHPQLCDESAYHRYIQVVVKQFCHDVQAWGGPHKLFMVVKYNAVFFDEKSYQQMCRSCC